MYIADFHIHSRYSRATSPQMNIEEIARWARYKGIHLVGTGDFTHPLWLYELKEKLEPSGRTGIFSFGGVDFVLTSEVCNIFDKKGKTKKLHNMLIAGSFEEAERLNQVLEGYGELNVDGRPILKLDARELVSIVEGVSRNAFVIPAHIWTPHFSLFGSNSGFDRIEECFGDKSDRIFAAETGLSSDPAMNWRVSALDCISLVSNSDAHSPNRLGREANVFSGPFDFTELERILREKDTGSFLFTIEYFPEEGKYHCDGHRNCKVCFSPEETGRHGGRCPVCGGRITIGVLHRVSELADRPDGGRPLRAPGFCRLVPLDQIIGCVFEKGVEAPSVQQKYLDIVSNVAPELPVLLETPEDELLRLVDREIAEAVVSVRNGQVNVQPGYDGEFGKIEIRRNVRRDTDQQSLF